MNRDQPRERIDKEMAKGIEDTMLVSYLRLCGFTVIPWICWDNPSDPRVMYDVESPGREVEDALANYYADDPVPVYSFVKSVRETKHQIYNMKKITNKPN